MTESPQFSIRPDQYTFSSGEDFFQNVHIYGTLYYDYRANGVLEIGDLEVSGNSLFSGITTFSNDVNIVTGLEVGILTVRKKLDVGVGGTILTTSSGNIGIGSATPIQRLDVVGNATISGNVGLGSTQPEQKLDVGGSVKINQDIYDASNSPGPVGGFLTKDAQGIKWTEFEPSFTEGIFVYNDGVLVGPSSYRGLNFRAGVNTTGVSTDNVQAFQSLLSANIADVRIYDYWGTTSTGNIYRNSNVGINNNDPQTALDVAGKINVLGELEVSSNVLFNYTLDVDDATTLNNTLDVDGATTLNSSLDVDGATTLNNILDVDGATTLNSSLDVDGDVTFNSTTQSTNKDTGSLIIQGGVGIEKNLNLGGQTTIGLGLLVGAATTLSSTLTVGSATTLSSTLTVGSATTLSSTLYVGAATTLSSILDVYGNVKLYSSTNSTDKDTGALVVEGGVGIEKNLNVGQNTKLIGSLELDSTLIDINGSVAAGKTDYRLSSVGTGVSWRPPGVQTQNIIYVTKDGNDSNSGLLEGDAKATVGAAASIAQDGDTIYIRPGIYYENNPIGLRTDVTVSGQDLRLVTIIPNNINKDVFHVRRGCLIENLNFAGSNISIAHTGAAAVAFPPTPSDVSIGIAHSAITGYLGPGPATEGPTGRWRSPYIRNCTNFMTKSIGMKINGDHATAATIGNDLKCMVCDSFTQYNENGIGVSITNSGYAQLVSIFTINCDIAIYCDTGGSCDLTNSNSSFGNYGLYAVGLGRTEFTARVITDTAAETDTIRFTSVSDLDNSPRRPYDGQSVWFKINLSNYPDAVGVGTITYPLTELDSITVLNGGSGFSANAPPSVVIRDFDGTLQPKGPQGIIAQASATVNDAGQITAIDVVSTGRNYLPTQNIVVDIEGNTGLATAVMSPIYYTVFEATAPTPPNHRYADAVRLIMENLDFIATEAVDRMLYYYNVTLGTPFSVPGGSQECVSDVNLVLKSIAYNLQFGGNDATYDAAKIYVDNAYLAGEEAESIRTYNYARDVAKQIINNVIVTKQGYTGINVYTQFRDLTIIADPSPASGSPSNTNPDSCTDVKNSIDTFFAIITTAIDPASIPRLPVSRTSGNTVGISTVVFNEFIPYELFQDDSIELRRISRILTSGHSFEYIGTGVDINISTPFQGAVPIKANEIVAKDGAQIPFTSTDQKGNFDIGAGIQVDQTTSTIRGRDFSRAIQAEVTPLILALR